MAGERVRTLRPWLYRIAHNTSLNMLRDRALVDEPLSDQIDGVERPDQAAERRQHLADVLAAVKALPARQRDAIVLRELEGRSYEQIAKGLGVSDGAVRQLLNRARSGVRSGVAALTPFGLLARLAAPFGDAPATVAAGGGGGGGGGGGFAVGKLCAAALAAAVAGGGVSGLPDRPLSQSKRAGEAAASDKLPAKRAQGAAAAASARTTLAATSRASVSGGSATPHRRVAATSPSVSDSGRTRPEPRGRDRDERRDGERRAGDRHRREGPAEGDGAPRPRREATAPRPGPHSPDGGDRPGAPPPPSTDVAAAGFDGDGLGDRHDGPYDGTVR